MPTEKTWQEWLERFYNLRRDKRCAHERPHKPILLLAILDLPDHRPATGQTMAQLHFHVIPRYAGDVPDPRGGIRHVIASKARYWQEPDQVCD